LNDALLASGSGPVVELPVGRHVITLVVTDDYGGADDDDVVINVTGPDQIYSNLADAGFAYSIYPNPFTNNMNMVYSLDEPQHVKMELTDISGKVVATWIDTYLEPGSYTLNIEGNGLKNGIYYLRIAVGETFYDSTPVIKN
jgi:hypothetical protein